MKRCVYCSFIKSLANNINPLIDARKNKARIACLGNAAAALLLMHSAALAQQWDGRALGFMPPDKGLTGDMAGVRPWLQERGFQYDLGYLSQLAYNAGGGDNHDRHAAYIDQFALTFTQDLEALTAIPDAKLEGNIVNRNHDDSLTSRRLQDNRVALNDMAQESAGRGSITRLGWFTFSRSFDQRRLHWRIGMINKVQDFDQIIPCDFQLLSQCGGKSANAMSWYNWNVHTWGTTLQYRLQDGLTLKGGIIEQNPMAPSRRQAWNTSTRGSKGVLLPVELEWKTHLHDLPGIYNLGVLFNNARQKDLYAGKSQVQGASDLQGYREHRRSWFLYAGFNQQLSRHQDDAARGLSLSWSMSLADQRTNPLQLVNALSLRYQGPFDARPEDGVGLGFSWIKLSRSYRHNQAALNQAEGIDDYRDPRYHPQPDYAANAELYYRIKAASWLQIQPDLQYWHRPGGLKTTQDAWVTGLKTTVTF